MRCRACGEWSYVKILGDWICTYCRVNISRGEDIAKVNQMVKESQEKKGDDD